MSYQNNRKEKIRESVKNPVFMVALVTVTVFALAVFYYLSKQGDDFRYEYEITADPASGESVYTDNAEPEENGSELFIGFGKLLNAGLTTEQDAFLRAAVKKYASDTNTELERVSYLKDSLRIPAMGVFEFTLVLNKDEEIIDVVYDCSETSGRKSSSVVFSKDGKEIRRF
jgi:hypothetical protein